MNPNMSMTHTEYAEANPSSPIEDALERMSHQHERLEKALRVLADRLEVVLQPAEPIDTLSALDGEKASIPRSLVTSRLLGAADDLDRTASRVEYLTSRLDT